MTGLDADTDYRFSVLSRDDLGNTSDASNEAPVRTRAPRGRRRSRR